MSKGNSKKWINPNDKKSDLELLELVMYGDEPTGEQDQAYEDLKKRLNNSQIIFDEQQETLIQFIIKIEDLKDEIESLGGLNER